MYTKKTLFWGLAIAVALLAQGGAWGLAVSTGTYTFSPTPKDLYDLDHGSAYAWGITLKDLDLSKQMITSAKMTIVNINNWKIEPDDILRVHLLDNPPIKSGVKVYNDNNSVGDYFKNQGEYLFDYTDDNEYAIHHRRSTEWVNPAETITYEFTQEDIDALTAYILNDGVFGFGFDPDCHFYNDCIKFEFCVADKPVPEPASLTLLGLGISGLVLRRFRHRLS